MKIKSIICGMMLGIISLNACNNDHDYVSNDPSAATEAPACYDVNDLYQQYSVLFKPSHGWVGDPMPFFENGNFYVFYLQDARDGADTFHPWYEVSTKDFMTYTDNGEMIPCGNATAQDGALGTGSVFKHNGVYYGFYTGHNSNLDPKEKVMLATSSDLKTWTKDTSFELQASDGYDRNEFRDPLIIKEGTSFKMLISTRADVGGGSWKAVLAQYTSTDLKNWTLDSNPFFYIEDNAYMVECPDVFVEGNYQYLVYSDINDRKVHYKYRKIGTTNWTTPSNSALDGIAYYAGKTASDGTNRYLFGWCPTRDNNSDYNSFGWGGSLVVHKLTQNIDGTLYVSIAQSLSEKLSTVSSLNVESGVSTQSQGNTFALNASDNKAYTVFERQSGVYKISAKIKPTTSTSFGFDFGACGNLREVFSIVFDTDKKELRLDKVVVNTTPVTMTSVDLPISANNEYDVTIVVENSVCVVYVNNQIAFTNRIYKMNQNPWAIFANNGNVSFTDLNISK